MNERIQVGDWVVLASSDGKRVLGHATTSATARLGRRKRKIGAIIGAYWGDSFAVKSGDFLQRISNSTDSPILQDYDVRTEKNNQYLHDDTQNQLLKQGDILQLKEKGVEGEELVQAVVSNSATFRGKTAFSQEKYLKRKREKFDLKVRVFRPTALTLCETYFQRSPEKTMQLRPDALGILLGYSGVRSGCHTIVYENCNGLLTAAVAERMNGLGKIINVFSGSTPPGIEIVRMLDLDSDRKNNIVNTPTELLGKVHMEEAIDHEALRYVAKEDLDIPRKDGEHQPSARRAQAIALRAKRGDVKQWLRHGCDCLLVATRFDVVQVFDTLLKFLAPSGCFAAYCTHLQDAADLQYALQLSKMAVRVELLEASMITHQILPGRCHPEMTDSATGGYIVTGIRIVLEPREANTN